MLKALESMILTAFTGKGSPALPARLVEAFVVRDGVEVQFRAASALDLDAALERIQSTPFWSGLARTFELAVEVAPQGLLCEAKAYGHMSSSWVQFRGGRTRTLTELLKDNDCTLRATDANRVLLARGILEERQRPSRTTPHAVRKFKVLTAKGLRYGSNEENPNSPAETSPRYFPEHFAELRDLYLK